MKVFGIIGPGCSGPAASLAPLVGEPNRGTLEYGKAGRGVKRGVNKYLQSEQLTTLVWLSGPQQYITNYRIYKTYKNIQVRKE